MEERASKIRSPKWPLRCAPSDRRPIDWVHCQWTMISIEVMLSRACVCIWARQVSSNGARGVRLA